MACNLHIPGQRTSYKYTHEANTVQQSVGHMYSCHLSKIIFYINNVSKVNYGGAYTVPQPLVLKIWNNSQMDICYQEVDFPPTLCEKMVVSVSVVPEINGNSSTELFPLMCTITNNEHSWYLKSRIQVRVNITSLKTDITKRRKKASAFNDENPFDINPTKIVHFNYLTARGSCPRLLFSLVGFIKG